MDTLGWPSRTILDSAVHSKFFFRHVDSKTVPRQEYQWTPWKKHQVPLWERINVKHEQPTDLELFFDLVSQMLIYDPEKRITPEEALNHPFIVRGPAARNRAHNDPPCAPHQQTIPSYVLPPWGYPAYGGFSLSRAQDPSVLHERKQRKLRFDHFSLNGVQKRGVTPLLPETPKKKEMAEIPEEEPTDLKESPRGATSLEPSKARSNRHRKPSPKISSPVPKDAKNCGVEETDEDFSASTETLPSITVTLVLPTSESQK